MNYVHRHLANDSPSLTFLTNIQYSESASLRLFSLWINNEHGYKFSYFSISGNTHKAHRFYDYVVFFFFYSSLIPTEVHIISTYNISYLHSFYLSQIPISLLSDWGLILSIFHHIFYLICIAFSKYFLVCLSVCWSFYDGLDIILFILSTKLIFQSCGTINSFSWLLCNATFNIREKHVSNSNYSQLHEVSTLANCCVAHVGKISDFRRPV